MLVLEALKKRIDETPNKICISSPEEAFTFLRSFSRISFS